MSNNFVPRINDLIPILCYELFHKNPSQENYSACSLCALVTTKAMMTSSNTIVYCALSYRLSSQFIVLFDIMLGSTSTFCCWQKVFFSPTMVFSIYPLNLQRWYNCEQVHAVYQTNISCSQNYGVHSRGYLCVVYLYK